MKYKVCLPYGITGEMSRYEREHSCQHLASRHIGVRVRVVYDTQHTYMYKATLHINTTGYNLVNYKNAIKLNEISSWR